MNLYDRLNPSAPSRRARTRGDRIAQSAYVPAPRHRDLDAPPSLIGALGTGEDGSSRRRPSRQRRCRSIRCRSCHAADHRRRPARGSEGEGRRGTLRADRVATERSVADRGSASLSSHARNLPRSSPAEQLALSTAERNRLIDDIGADVLGYGPLETAARRTESVSEIMVNRYDQVYVERNGRLDRDAAPVHRRGAASAGHRADRRPGRPPHRRVVSLVDARLEDGSRVNAIIPPLAVDGSSLTIRKFAGTPYTVRGSLGFGTLRPRSATVLDAAVRAKLNILVSGGTGTGKTTLLNVLSAFIPTDERIITIEDAVELQLQQEHVVRLESRPAEHRGSGRDHDPRPRAQLASHAA